MLSFWWAILLPSLVSFVTTYAHLLMSFRLGNPTPLSIALIWAIPSLLADLIIFATAKLNMLERLRQGTLEPSATFRPAGFP